MTSPLRTALRETANLCRGSLSYLATGVTPIAAQQSLVNLFCLTGGLSNEAAHAVICCMGRPRALPEPRGVVGALSREDLREIKRDLDSHGYHIFSRRLPTE